jgi:hypothetical protein
VVAQEVLQEVLAVVAVTVVEVIEELLPDHPVPQQLVLMVQTDLEAEAEAALLAVEETLAVTVVQAL